MSKPRNLTTIIQTVCLTFFYCCCCCWQTCRVEIKGKIDSIPPSLYRNNFTDQWSDSRRPRYRPDLIPHERFTHGQLTYQFLLAVNDLFIYLFLFRPAIARLAMAVYWLSIIKWLSCNRGLDRGSSPNDCRPFLKKKERGPNLVCGPGPSNMLDIRASYPAV